MNCILHGDSAGISGDEIYIYAGTRAAPIFSWSIVSGSGGSASWNPALGTNGGHNIDVDPQLWLSAEDNLRLLPDSPAIDAGSNAALPAGTTVDLDGLPRIVGGTVDLGAYESDYAPRRIPSSLTGTPRAPARARTGRMP